MAADYTLGEKAAAAIDWHVAGGDPSQPPPELADWSGVERAAVLAPLGELDRIIRDKLGDEPQE